MTDRPKRSKREKDNFGYIDFDDDDDFESDFTRVKADSSNKKAKTETNKENDEKKTKKKTERPSVKEKVFERDLQKAIEMSKSEISQPGTSAEFGSQGTIILEDVEIVEKPKNPLKNKSNSIDSSKSKSTDGGSGVEQEKNKANNKKSKAKIIDDDDDDFILTKKTKPEEKKAPNPKKPKAAKKVDEDDVDLNKLNKITNPAINAICDDVVVVETDLVATTTENKNDMKKLSVKDDEPKKPDATAVVIEQEKKTAVKKAKAKKSEEDDDDNDFKASKNNNNNSDDSDSDFEVDSKAKGKKKPVSKAEKTTKSKRATNQPKQQQINNTVESVEVKKPDQKPFVNPSVKTIKNLNVSASTSSPLGRIEIKSPAYTRVGLSRKSNVKPLHPNAKIV